MFKFEVCPIEVNSVADGTFLVLNAGGMIVNTFTTDTGSNEYIVEVYKLRESTFGEWFGPDHDSGITHKQVQRSPGVWGFENDFEERYELIHQKGYPVQSEAIAVFTYLLTACFRDSV